MGLARTGKTSRKVLKYVLLGEGGVGKTSIRRSFLGDEFKESYRMTIGADLSVLRTDDYVLQIYDLAGQIGYRLIRSSYYFGAQGGILVFALDRKDSMEAMDNWLHELYSQVPLEIPIIVVGNKSDLRDQVNTIEREEAELKVNELQEKYPGIIGYIESSAKEGLNVDEIFQRLTETLLNPGN